MFCLDSRWRKEILPHAGASAGRQDIRRGEGRHHGLHSSLLTQESYREREEHTFGRLWEVWSRAGESSVSKRYSLDEMDTRQGRDPIGLFLVIENTEERLYR